MYKIPRKKHMRQMSLRELRIRLNSNVLTSARAGVAATRLADEYNERVSPGNNSKKASAIVCIDTGLDTTIGGKGHLLEQFKNKEVISAFTGCATNPVKTSDDMFDEARFKEVSFKDTFVLQKYDVSKSDYYDAAVDGPPPQKKKRRNAAIDDKDREKDFLPDLPEVRLNAPKPSVQPEDVPMAMQPVENAVAVAIQPPTSILDSILIQDDEESADQPVVTNSQEHRVPKRQKRRHQDRTYVKSRRRHTRKVQEKTVKGRLTGNRPLYSFNDARAGGVQQLRHRRQLRRKPSATPLTSAPQEDQNADGHVSASLNEDTEQDLDRNDENVLYAHVTNPHSQDTSPDSQVSQNPTENISAYPENTFLVQNELVHGNKDQFNSEIPDNLTFSDLLLVDDALKDIDLSLYDAKD